MQYCFQMNKLTEQNKNKLSSLAQSSLDLLEEGVPMTQDKHREQPTLSTLDLLEEGVPLLLPEHSEACQ